MRVPLIMRKVLTGNLASAYRQSDGKGKTRMLDEFVRQTGYNRKYALHLLTRWEKEIFFTVEGKPVKLKTGMAKRWKGCGRKPVYGPEVIASLRIIWAFFGYRYGKLLAPLIRDQMAFFEAWPPFRITADLKAGLLRISPRTRFRGGDHRPDLERGPEEAGHKGDMRHQTGKTPEKAHFHQDLLPLERAETGIFRD
jgi:hypothetical protein